MSLLRFTLLIQVIFGAASLVLASDIKDQCLSAHNALRALHQNTNSLKWSTSLAASAQVHAEKLMKLGKLLRGANLGRNVNENLYMTRSLCTATCAKATLRWYAEIAGWNFRTKTSTGIVNHFTQVVWKGTTELGVGIAYQQRSTGYTDTYVVARYRSAGNVPGQYAENIMPRKPGAQTPSLISLDKIGECCRDNPRYKCNDLKASVIGFCVVNKYKKYANALCKKTCKLC